MTLSVQERDYGALVVDHLRLISDTRYGRDVRLKIMAATRNRLAEEVRFLELRALHAPGGRCCRIEAWLVTLEELTEKLREDWVPAQRVRSETTSIWRAVIRVGRGPVYGPNVVQLPLRRFTGPAHE